MRGAPTRSQGLALVTAVTSLSLAISGVAAASSLEHAQTDTNRPTAHSSPPSKQPIIEARSKDVLRVERREFKDLNANGELDPYEDWRLPTAERAADLVSRMTLQEKAGLMQITSERGRGDESRPTPHPDTVGYVEDRHIRYLVIRDNPTAEDLATRANDYQEIAESSRLGIPIVFTSNPRNHVNPDQEFGISEATGQFSTWPGTLGLAAAHDPEMVREFAEIARREWRSSGIRKIYGYQVETATEPRWRRIGGTFGESPNLNADIAKQLVLGFQGEELSSESVAQTVKHFPGDGPVLNGLDPHNEAGKWAVYPTPGSLANYHLPPFQAAIDAGTSSVMSYYNVPSNEHSAQQLPRELWYSQDQQFEEVAAAYNHAILTDLLRGEMGFTGYVNSDSGVLHGMAYGVEELSLPERFAKAVRAGTSLFSDNNDPSGLIEAVSFGLLEESDLNPSVTLLVSEMFDIGLFEDPYVSPKRAQRIADSPASQAKADQAHRRSIVLLRNNEDALPLTGRDFARGKLFVEVVTGEDAAQKTKALKELVRERYPQAEIADSLDEATTALVWVRPDSGSVFGEEEPLSLQLGADNGIDVERVQSIEAAVPTVLAINMTNPWIIDQIEPRAAAVLATFNVKAEALLDAVRGRFSPTGGLPITLPEDQQAVRDNASDVPGYAEDFDYAYTDSAGNEYTFGFGLSYHR